MARALLLHEACWSLWLGSCLAALVQSSEFHSPDLPNFDCLGNPQVDELLSLSADIRMVLEMIEQSRSLSGWQTDPETQTSYFYVGGDLDSSGADQSFMWESYATSIFSLDMNLHTECPFAYDLLRVVQQTVCIGIAGGFRTDHPYLGFESEMACSNSTVLQQCAWLRGRVHLGAQLHMAPYGLDRAEEVLSVFFNTRFTARLVSLFSILRRQILHRVFLQASSVLDPLGVTREVVNSHTCSHFSQTESNHVVQTCVFGFLRHTLMQLAIISNYRTELYDEFAARVTTAFAHLNSPLDSLDDRSEHDSFTLLMFSHWDWPAYMFYAMKKIQHGNDDGQTYGPLRIPYSLDFRSNEMLHPLGGNVGLEDLRAMPRQQHISLLRSHSAGSLESNLSKSYQALLKALIQALEGQPEHNYHKLVFATVVWGAKYARYLPGFLQRAEAFGLGHTYLIFCLDDAACSACTASHSNPALCVPGGVQFAFSKLTLVAAVVHAGFDVMYLDFDVVFFRNPLPVLLEALRTTQAEVLVSRDFGSQCLNIGVFLLKACTATGMFLSALLKYLWRRPYEADQNAFSAFLGHANASSVNRGSHAPRWTVLDPETHFVTNVVYNKGIEGWTGKIVDIVVYHFLDGAGGVDDMFAMGEHVNLFELFYANPKLDLRNANVPLWHQDPRIEERLWNSWLPNATEKLTRCTQLDDKYLKKLWERVA